VADRIAWANGSTIESPAPNVLGYPGYDVVTPKLTLDEVATALGDGQEIMSAVATTADGVRSFDPRWNEVGQRLMWVVRSIPSTVVDATDPTRDVTVSLIDDSTGQVADSHLLALPADYNPARLWVTATWIQADWNNGQESSGFYGVQPATGGSVQDGVIGSGAGTTRGRATTGPDLPLLLNPGQYTLTAWLAKRDALPTDPKLGECSAEHSFSAGDDVMLTAKFPKQTTCSWSSGAEPSFGFP